MKKLVLLISLILVVSVVSAQEMPKDTILSKKEIKQKKKEEKEAKLQKQFENNYQILLDKSFVLETNYINNSINVSSNLNFILIDSSNTIIQTSSDFSAGSNGMGGSTVEGKILNYKLTKSEKHKVCSLIVLAKNDYFKFKIVFEVQSSGYARAWLEGEDGSIWLIFDGNIVLLKDTRVLKGNTFFK